MKRLPAIAVLVAVMLCAGCIHIPFIGKKKTAPSSPDTIQKPGPHIATDVEIDFRQRWVAKRASDLVAQGQTAPAAQAQALAEFRVKFSGTGVASAP